MTIPGFRICLYKGADQLRGNRKADQRLCFRSIDSTIPLLPLSKIFKPLAIFCGCTAWFVSDLVGNPEDRFCDAAHNSWETYSFSCLQKRLLVMKLERAILGPLVFNSHISFSSTCFIRFVKQDFLIHCIGEPGGLMVESLTPERETGGSISTSAMLCP